METRAHLAQVNSARMKTPLEDPARAGVVGGLDEVNALGEGRPGVGWRLRSEAGSAT